MMGINPQEENYNNIGQNILNINQLNLNNTPNSLNLNVVSNKNDKRGLIPRTL